MPYWNFFDYGRIAVTKSNRFSYVPAHKHQFIEMNYCYAGRSIQYIDNQKICLHPGELLIMDREIQQRINYARKEDILVNILIRDNYEIMELLNNLHNKDTVLINFLDNISKRNFYHHNYLVFDLNKDIVAKQLIENIISVGLNNHGKNSQLLHMMLQAFILKCSDDLILKQETIFSNLNLNKDLQIIDYINEHYKHLTLKELAIHFGYNPNYLGNLLNKVYGHSFKELLQMRRLNIACNLLQNGNYSIERISEYVGYENHSSLFRLFKKYLEITPQEYRRLLALPRQLDNEENNIIPNPYFKD